MTLPAAMERLRAMGANPIYSSELVRADLVVGVEPVGRTPREILQEILAPHGLTVNEGPGGALLVSLAPEEAKTGTIRGTVSARDTGRPLSGASIQIEGQEGLWWTDPGGRFEIDAEPPGTIVVRVSAAGYIPMESESIIVDAGTTAVLDFELSPQPLFLRQVVVTPSKYGLLQKEMESRVFLDREEVRRTPHLSDDVFRVVHRVPGVAAGDFSSAFALRGSAPDEIKFVFEGLHIEEPYHLRDYQSFLSMIDSEAVAGVEVLSGGYPVEYGDRMGGVVNLSSVVPDISQYSIGISSLTTRASAQNTYAGGAGSWLASVRHGFFDMALRWFNLIDEGPDLVNPPHYSDIYAVWRRPLGETNRFSTHLLGSTDSFHFLDEERTEDAEVDANTVYLWSNLDARWQSGLSARTTFFGSWIRSSIKGVAETRYSSYAEVSDKRRHSAFGLKQDWVYEPSRRHLFKWGAEARWVGARYDYDGYTEIWDPVRVGTGPIQVTTTRINTTPSGRQFGLYIADRLRLFPNVTAELGLRWDRQSWTPGSDQFSPRLNIVWDIPKIGILRASWGRFTQSQAIHELQVEDGIETFYPAQESEHQVISLEHLTGTNYQVRIDAYRKVMTDLWPRYENLFEPIKIFPAGEPDRVRIQPTRALAQGIELMVKSPPGDTFSWWLGCAFSSAKDRVDGVWQPRSWDQSYAFSFSTNWALGEQWNINLAGTFHSGWPKTPVFGSWVQIEDGSWVPIAVAGDRNSARYPSYRRFDIRISREQPTKRGRLRYFFEITNLFNYDNIRSTGDFSFFAISPTEIGSTMEFEEWMPILPSFGLIWEF